MASTAETAPGAPEIRLARSADLDRIPAIEQAAAALFPETDLPLALRFRVSDMQDLRDALAEERIWVAASGPQAIAGYAMADVVDGQAYLVEVDVLPPFGRQGIGTRLVSQVIVWARARRFRYLVLVTFRHLPWNAPFYAKLGFTEMSRRQSGPQLRALMAEEKHLGLSPDNRVAMQLDL